MTSQIGILRLEADRGDPGAAEQSRIRAIGGAWNNYFDHWAEGVDITRGYKSYLRRASKLLFLGEVVGRELRSTKELTQGESLRIIRWLVGQHPSPRVRSPANSEAVVFRKGEVATWISDNMERLAEAVKRLRVESTHVESAQDLPDIVVQPVGVG
jgi:hypothetical protein